MSARRLAVLATATLLLSPALAACSDSADDSSDGASEPTPGEVLALASDKLTETSGVELDLAAGALPQGVSGIAKAAGTITDAPAFDGTLTVVFAGQTADVPVIAAGGDVFAQLPFTDGEWQKVNPQEYGAPDPSTLIGADGFPGLLGQTESIESGASVRGGADNDEILTTYTGTVPGTAMKSVIPSSAGDSFEVEWQVTDDGELRTATLTGVFYPQTDPMTYTVEFADYGIEKDIQAP